LGEENKTEDHQVDQRIIELNSIFEELISNAEELTRDLLGSISQWPMTGALCFLLAILFGWYMFDFTNVSLGKINSIPSVGSLILILICGAASFWKYFQLKKKYSRLFEIQKELREHREN
jgi:hypothetical protein